MKQNPLKDGVLRENSVGIGTVTYKMVRERAIELATMDERSSAQMTESDLEQAKRELTGKPDMDPKETALDSGAKMRDASPPARNGDIRTVATGKKCVSHHV